MTDGLRNFPGRGVPTRKKQHPIWNQLIAKLQVLQSHRPALGSWQATLHRLAGIKGSMAEVQIIDHS